MLPEIVFCDLPFFNGIDQRRYLLTSRLSCGVTASTIKPSANSDLLFYNGDVLYIENRSPITRATEQIENYKVIIGF